MPDTPEEATNDTKQPFEGSAPEGLVEDKEKAVDMAYAGKARVEAAMLMEKVNPREAALLRSKAEELEKHAGEVYDAQTEKFDEAMGLIGEMIAMEIEGRSPIPVVVTSDKYPVDRVRQGFYGLFDAFELRNNTEPKREGGNEGYHIQTAGWHLYESVDSSGTAHFGVRKTIPSDEL